MYWRMGAVIWLAGKTGVQHVTLSCEKKGRLPPEKTNVHVGVIGRKGKVTAQDHHT